MRYGFPAFPEWDGLDLPACQLDLGSLELPTFAVSVWLSQELCPQRV